MADILQNTDAYTQASFSLKNRLLRLIWNIVYVVLFKFSPPPLRIWRSFLLRCFGAKIGKRCHVYPKAKIWAPWNLAMDDYACIADDVICYSMAKITLGKKVVISQGTFLCAGSHDYQDPHFRLFAKPIKIEANVWVAAQAFVTPGVTIGEGAVIGARSVVTEDMPAWMVCVGNPCKPIKTRELRKD
ncbi:MAG: WcaF family extracellular polysaccharide biosynthesis acetyltransferase [Candidatus Omnitrophota bacterium]|nr:MAG: WcaF family extracellular polysaccharide biosynthesis acetyltransferase [Candidatus Omnitrophota bacterium]